MPLVQNFSATQTLGEESTITLEDTSTGSDASVTQRRVYLAKADGSYLTPDGTSTDYIEWAYANDTVDIDALDKDYALNITVQWLDASNVVLYTKTTLWCFTLYNETFYYSLTQNQSSDPNIVRDTNYYNNKLQLRVEIDNAEQAVDIGGDIQSAQEALDRAKYLVDNENLYF